MKSILFYSTILLALEYGLGYGLARRMLPKTLIKYSLLLGPWVLNIFLIIALVIASLLGISAELPSIIVSLGLILLTFFERKNFAINWKELLIFGIVGASTVVSNSPLILRERFLTTISLGNNDVIAYASTSDYLVGSSIDESLREAVILPVANLLHDGYRWGTPLLQSFFLSVTRLDAWQITYLMQTILFATMVPLLYVLYEQWYGKDKFSWWLVLLAAFNANLLYMLYHNFYGQVIYWGILLMITILFTSYLRKSSRKLEWLIGASIAAMYMAYHEPATFVLFPLIVAGILSKKWQGILRIAGITALIASVSVMNAVIFDFGQAFQGNPEQPIGWDIFRQESPTSNPFEITGLTSVHTNDPLPPPLAWGLSILIAGIWAWGVVKSKIRIYTLPMMGFYLLMLLWTSLGKNGNWFVFNRAVTYVLPLLLVVLAGGVLTITRKHWRYGIVAIASVMVVRSGLLLNWKLVNSHLSVHAWYPTLALVQEQDVQEPLFTTGMMSDEVSIWDQIWIGYFLYPNVNDGTIPNLYENNDNIPVDRITDGSLVLLNKTTVWDRYPSYLLNKVEWDNGYYLLGRLCVSDLCLIDHPKEMSRIEFGVSGYEDTLLGKGWSTSEREARWANAMSSTVRLVGSLGYSRIAIEAKSLESPQKMTVIIDGVTAGEQEIGKEWREYIYYLPILSERKIHHIEFQYSNQYKPSKVLGNNDNRDLTVRFRTIRLEE